MDGVEMRAGNRQQLNKDDVPILATAGAYAYTYNGEKNSACVMGVASGTPYFSGGNTRTISYSSTVKCGSRNIKVQYEEVSLRDSSGTQRLTPVYYDAPYVNDNADQSLTTSGDYYNRTSPRQQVRVYARVRITTPENVPSKWTSYDNVICKPAGTRVIVCQFMSAPFEFVPTGTPSRVPHPYDLICEYSTDCTDLIPSIQIFGPPPVSNASDNIPDDFYDVFGDVVGSTPREPEIDTQPIVYHRVVCDAAEAFFVVNRDDGDISAAGWAFCSGRADSLSVRACIQILSKQGRGWVALECEPKVGYLTKARVRELVTNTIFRRCTDERLYRLETFGFGTHGTTDSFGDATPGEYC
jgi:hypothetical protein